MSNKLSTKPGQVQAEMAETRATTIEGLARKLCICEDGFSCGISYKRMELLRSATSDACFLTNAPRPRSWL